jgi:hypothetical protein
MIASGSRAGVGLRGAVVIVTGAVIPLDGGQVIDRE